MYCVLNLINFNIFPVHIFKEECFTELLQRDDFLFLLYLIYKLTININRYIWNIPGNKLTFWYSNQHVS